MNVLWLVGLFLLLGGCSSPLFAPAHQPKQEVRWATEQPDGTIERYSVLTYERVSNGEAVAEQLPMPATMMGDTSDSCPIYQKPENPKIPPIPVIAANARNEQIDNQLFTHIKELREYIYDYRKLIQKSYDDYLIACGEPVP